MSNGTKVKKRNGSIEPLDLEKMHKMVDLACDGLGNVSASQVEIQSGLQFYDGISTDEIQNILIRSASDLITLDNPNYQFVAARLLLFALRKQLYGKIHDIPNLSKHIEDCIDKGIYDSAILDKYSSAEFSKFNGWIDHDRDYLFTYAGLRQVADKYLVQDRSTGKVYETPQFMYMMIAATIFAEYPKDTRLHYIKRYYDAISKHKINIPTPIMGGVRTPIRQFASCVLVDIDDTLDSIFSSDMAIGRYVAQRAGIGINAGRIRGINAKIRGGEVQHTGVVPFLKKFESTVRCCTQNGIRGGSATVHFPIWHQEIQDILVLKNNKGTEDNRVRKLDYSIQISQLFYERFIMNIDHCNSHSSFQEKVNMSNLCQEITLPTDPIQHIDGAGEIALCILSAINVGKVQSDKELEDLCDLSVRALDEIIDYQEYPVKAAEISTRSRRSLGVGFIGLAHYLAKLGFDYDSQEAWDAVHGLTESFQYFLLKSSNKLAQEKGACEYFNRTKYSLGKLPIDHFKTDVNEITKVDLVHDWQTLRTDIKKYGLRNSTLSAQMPSESSSVVSNATNGIEPPRDYLSIKKSKKGPLKQIVPSYQSLKNNYTLLWEMKSNKGYINIVAVMQKFFDQAISGNWSYNPENYPDNEVPVTVMAQDLLTTYKYGWKTSYYQNTNDLKSDEIEEPISTTNLLTEIENLEEENCESCTI